MESEPLSAAPPHPQSQRGCTERTTWCILFRVPSVGQSSATPGLARPREPRDPYYSHVQSKYEKHYIGKVKVPHLYNELQPEHDLVTRNFSMQKRAIFVVQIYADQSTEIYVRGYVDLRSERARC